MNKTYTNQVMNGIDRINNAIGYINNNVVPCCWKCNRFKGNMDREELLKHATKVCLYNHLI